MRRLLAVGAVAAVVGSGCVVDVDFDPFGRDFALQGEWTVNGQAPSTTDCPPVDAVRVIFWDEGTFFAYSDLTFPCNQGTFATGPIFEFGSYETQWQALEATGSVLAQGRRTPLIVSTPTASATLQAIDFDVE